MTMTKRISSRIAVATLSALPAAVALPLVAHAQLISSGDAPSGVPRQSNLRVTIINIINYVLTFVGIIAVIVFIYAGILYLVSGANADATKNAKSMMVNAIIGIIIILLSFVIVNTIITQGSGAIQGQTQFSI